MARTLLVLLVVLLAGEMAWAEDAPDDSVDLYNQLISEGAGAFVKKDYELALDKFTKAYAIDSSDPGLLWNIARTQEEMKDYDAAITFLGFYIQGSPGQDKVEKAYAKIQYLELKKKEAALAANPPPPPIVQKLDAQTSIASGASSEDTKPVSASPGIVTVIDAEDLAVSGVTTVAEALSQVAGIYVLTDHISPNVGIRGVVGTMGSYSSVLKAMISGFPVSNRMTTGNLLGLECIPLGAVERIEVMRGPSSVLYGENAFLGAVNIVPRLGATFSKTVLGIQGGLLESGAVSFGGGVVSGYGTDTIQFLAAVSWHRLDMSGTELATSSPDYEEFVAGSPSEDHVSMPLSVFTQIKYVPVTDATLSLTAGLQKLDTKAEYFYVYPLTHDTTIKRLNTFVGATYNQSFLDDAVALTMQAGYLYGAPSDDTRIAFGVQTLSAVESWSYHTFLDKIELDVAFAPWLTLKLGFDHSLDHLDLPAVDKRYTAEADKTGYFSKGDRQEAILSNYGRYVMLTTGYADRFALKLGARYDNHTVYGDTFTWSASGVLTLEKILSIKLLYGTSFKAPSPFQLYAAPIVVDGVIGSPHLAPQYAHTLEGQVGLTFDWGLKIALTGYYNYIDDMVQFVAVGGNFRAANVSGIETFGTELELRWLFQGLSVGLTVSYQDTSSALVDSDDLLLQSIFEELGGAYTMFPDLMFGSVISYFIEPAHLVVHVSGKYVGERLPSQVNIMQNAELYSLDPFFMLDAGIGTKGLTFWGERETRIYLKATNLLDAQAISPGYNGFDTRGLHRMYWLTIEQAF